MLDGDAVGDAAYDPIAAAYTDFVQRLDILNARTVGRCALPESLQRSIFPVRRAQAAVSRDRLPAR
jgi:hypothetical protein